MTILEKEYVKCSSYKPMTLDSLYNDNNSIEILDYNLLEIINTEAPITLNILKERLRESFGVKKISGKALEIIENEIKKIGFTVTDNYYDKVYWPVSGDFFVKHLRTGYKRQIYDIPLDEMRNLSIPLIESGLSEEELYRAILKYFGYEVLTEKALNYLRYIEENSKN